MRSFSLLRARQSCHECIHEKAACKFFIVRVRLHFLNTGIQQCGCILARLVFEPLQSDYFVVRVLVRAIAGFGTYSY